MTAAAVLGVLVDDCFHFFRVFCMVCRGTMASLAPDVKLNKSPLLVIRTGGMTVAAFIEPIKAFRFPILALSESPMLPWAWYIHTLRK